MVEVVIIVVVVTVVVLIFMMVGGVVVAVVLYTQDASATTFAETQYNMATSVNKQVHIRDRVPAF